MAPGDFASTAGKQRAVWVQTGGSVLVGNSTEHFDVIVIEAGTAVRDDFLMEDDSIQRTKLVIPIMVLPPGANVIKTVASVSTPGGAGLKPAPTNRSPQPKFDVYHDRDTLLFYRDA